MIPNDPKLGPVLSAVILVLLLCILFLVLTLPFSAVLHSDPASIAAVISALSTLAAAVVVARGMGRDREK